MEPDLDRLLADAWAKVEARIERQPDQLARRLARRRSLYMQSIPRAWCLAVRANDRRIHIWSNLILNPERPIWFDNQRHRWNWEEHTVLLEKQDLCWLCRPEGVYADTAHAVAHNLGVSVNAVNRWMRRGQVRFRHIKGLGGVRGSPVPLIYVTGELDPQMQRGTQAHVAWGTQWRYVSEHVPEDLDQTLLRRPVIYDRHGRRHFSGWRWVCPVCGKDVRTVYYPMPAHYTASFVKPYEQWDLGPERPERRFACAKCNRVRRLGSDAGRAWGQLVMHLSGGLLYGREVPRPQWFVVKRQHQHYVRRSTGFTPRQAKIMEWLINTDLSCWAIGKRLGTAAVHVDAKLIYKKAGVSGREELKAARAAEVRPEGKAAG